METTIQVFKSPQFGMIRTYGTADNPMFCLADICRVLEISNVTDTRNRLKQDGLGQIEVIDKIGRKQFMYFVNEQNLYRVIMRSDKPQAEPFQDWVCGEVLPSIRKHGIYATAATIESILADPDNMIQVLEALKKERQQREEAEKEMHRLEAQAVEDQPKVVFADAIVGSNTSCLIGELAKIITQNGYRIGQNRLFAWLREHHYLGTVGEYYNIPCQKYLEMGLFELKKNVHSQNGQMVTTITPKVTGRGQLYFVNKFINPKVS